MGRKCGLAACAAGVAGLAACTSGPQPGEVAKQWQQSMSELHIAAIFPPREDVQVGDVYLSGTLPDGSFPADSALKPQMWFDSVRDAGVKDFYKTRYSFPPSPKDANASGDSKDAAPSGPYDPPSATDVFATPLTPANRLRLVAFPSFTVASVTKAALSGSGPVGIVDILGSLTAGSDYTLSVTIPQAESYGVPVRTALESFGNTCKNDSSKNDSSYVKHATELVQGFGDGTLPITPVITLVTEVYYARAIDYTVEVNKSAGSSISATIAQADKLKEALAALRSGNAPANSPSNAGTTPGSNGGNAPPPAAPNTPSPASANPSASDQAAALQRQLDKLNAQLAASPVPGVSGSLLYAEGNTIKLQEKFPRPVAVGFRGVSLRPSGRQSDQYLCGMAITATPSQPLSKPMLMPAPMPSE